MNYPSNQLKIYFAASIRGGRKDQNKYNELIGFLSSKVEVLTEHVGDSSLGQTGEQDFTDKEIYQRDLEWLESADAVIAEVTNPSLGVGYELGVAEKLGKPVLCLFDDSDHNRNLSAMISGNHKITTFRYTSLDQAKEEMVSFIHSVS
jgi:nucleoside 2-deoxyribosyltransferase